MNKSKPNEASDPHQAFLDAGAEVGMETLKARRWIFLAAAVVIGIGFPAIGISAALLQNGLPPKLFGVAFTIAGVLGYLAMISAYRKARQFVGRYEEKLASSD